MKDLLAVQVLLTRAWSVTCTGGPWCCCHCQGFAWEPIPALPGALWTWKPWVRMAHLRGGQIPVLFTLPRADLGGFCPVQEDSSHRAAHPKVCFLVSGQFSLWKCQPAVGGRSKEPEPCSLPRQKQRRVVLVPFVQLCTDHCSSEQGWPHLSAHFIVRVYSPVVENILTLEISACVCQENLPVSQTRGVH